MSPKNIIGLQIGGEVGPDDQVGMHIVMPTSPGIGVQVSIENKIDQAVQDLVASVPKNHPDVEKVKSAADEILKAQSSQSKIEKLQLFVNIAMGITEIVAKAQQIMKQFLS